MLHLMMLAISRLILRFLIINLQSNLKKEQPKQREEHKVSTSKTVAVSTLTERLAEFKRQKAMEEVKIPLVDVETHTKPVTTKARKSRHDIKEGMKWAFILEKPKALRHRAR